MLWGGMKVLRAGPAPLTLVSLGRWASIAAAAEIAPAAAVCFILVRFRRRAAAPPLGRPSGTP